MLELLQLDSIGKKIEFGIWEPNSTTLPCLALLGKRTGNPCPASLYSNGTKQPQILLCCFYSWKELPLTHGAINKLSATKPQTSFWAPSIRRFEPGGILPCAARACTTLLHSCGTYLSLKVKEVKHNQILLSCGVVLWVALQELFPRFLEVLNCWYNKQKE